MKITKELIFSPKRLESSTWTGHIPFAAWLMQLLKPRVFVELGTYLGNSYFAFCQVVDERHLPTKCYAVDTWQGDEHSGYYKDTVFNSVQEHNKSYCVFSTLLRSTFDEALLGFADKSIDLLHIDGLHTYEAVRHDFETWRPKLSDQAIVLFHDIEVREKNFGVWKFWGELCQQYPGFSFQHSSGLGVLFVGPALNGELKAVLLNESLDETQIIKDFFAQLGTQLEFVAKHHRLRKAVDSALLWQKKPWFKRAFHRWKMPK
jgi:hypothetical protein